MKVFEKFGIDPQSNFSSFSTLRNNILKKAPILYVDDPTDFSILKNQNFDTTHVWLVDKNIKTYSSFPWYFSPEEKNKIYKFPYVQKESREIISYDKTILVPVNAHLCKFKSVKEKYICGHYDPYFGKEKFDIFYIGEDKTVYDKLVERNFDVQVVENLKQAQSQSFTDMLWIVYDDTDVRDTFKFSYKPDEWSYDTPHVFGNGDIDQLDGIVLMPKAYNATDKEIKHRFFVNKKEIRIMASNPKPFDKFKINNFYDYEQALRKSTTELFWGYSDQIDINKSFKFDFYISHHSSDRKTNHAWLNSNKYNGVFLFSKQSPVTEEEIIFKDLNEKIEHDAVASVPKQFERFVIGNYQEYQEALLKCKTDMFWFIPKDVNPCENFQWDNYFLSQETFDTKTNHVFLNGEDYDGIALLSSKIEISEKEIEHRFFVNKKEHDVVASYPKPYDKFLINNYDDYAAALYNCKTEMFWGVPGDVELERDFDFNLYFSHHNSYDRNINHVFLNGNTYDGVVLFSKNVLVSEKEIEHRFLIKKKEWDIVASNPKPYPIYTVNNYQDYLNAKKDCSSDMFWMVNDSFLPVENFNWNFYIDHHNQYERKINHVWKNGEYYDGIALTSKKLSISQREIDYRFFVTKKEYPEVGSNPKPYDIVFISNGEPNADDNFDLLSAQFPRAKRVMDIKGIHAAHKRAAELVETDMFWVVDGDAEIIDGFEFDYYVPAYDIDGKDTVHVWRSLNPINGLIYGYGGVKLLPTNLTRNMDESTTDMTTSISDKFKGIEEMSNTSAFNTDSFSAWRSGFRECAKLASRTIARQKDEETEFRLEAWCTRGADKPFGKAAIAGAIAGKEFGELNKDNTEELAKINDFEWLKEEFKKLYQ